MFKVGNLLRHKKHHDFTIKITGTKMYTHPNMTRYIFFEMPNGSSNEAWAHELEHLFIIDALNYNRFWNDVNA